MQVQKNAWQGLLFSSFTWKELRSCQVKKSEQTSTPFLGYRWQWTTQDRLLPPRLERPTGKYRDLWLYWNRGSHHRSQCRGRKTWAVLTNSWGLSVHNFETSEVQENLVTGIPTILWDLPPGAQPTSHKY